MYLTWRCAHVAMVVVPAHGQSWHPLMLLLLPLLQFLVLKGGMSSVPALLQGMQVNLTHDLQHVTSPPTAHSVCTLYDMTHHATVGKPSAICAWFDL